MICGILLCCLNIPLIIKKNDTSFMIFDGLYNIPICLSHQKHESVACGQCKCELSAINKLMKYSDIKNNCKGFLSNCKYLHSAGLREREAKAIGCSHLLLWTKLPLSHREIRHGLGLKAYHCKCVRIWEVVSNFLASL